MGTFVEVASLNDLAPGRALAVEVRGRAIALFHRADGIRAIDDTCSHSGASLAEGEVEGHNVICPWHGASFDICTGKRGDDIASYDLRCYAVRVEGERVAIEWPE